MHILWKAIEMKMENRETNDSSILGPCGAEDWIEEECEKCGNVGDCWNGLCADCLASNLRDE